MSLSCFQEPTPHPSLTVSTSRAPLDHMTNHRIVAEVLKAAQEPIDNVVDTVSKLSQAASKMPYYKFNSMWSRQMQGAV